MNENIIVSKDIIGWLRENGWNCWLNQKNNFDIPVFNTKGGGSKCDVLARKGAYVIGIEVKPGEMFQDILNGFRQVLDYAGEYNSGDIIYLIEGEPTHIDVFVLATKYSNKGYIYAYDGGFPSLNFSDEYFTSKNIGEKPITFTFTRLLWRNWQKGGFRDYYEGRRIGNKTNNSLPKYEPKVGVLVAKINRSTNEISKEPYIYINNNTFQNLKTMEAV